MRFLISISISLILLFSAPDITLSQALISNNSSPLITLSAKHSQRFDMSLRIGKHHFNGMLIVKEMREGEVRIISTTYFGLSLFDISIRKTGEFIVNKCIEPMQRKSLLKLLERDFKLLLLPEQDMKLLWDTKYFKKYRKGSGFGKTYIGVFEEGVETSSKIELRHPWIKLYITLHPLLEN